MQSRIATLFQHSHLFSFQTGVMLLLSLYVALFVSSSGAPHAHGTAKLHSEALCHTDACHIAIYHPGSEGGCTHKAHFRVNEEDCPLCHLVLSRDHLMADLAMISRPYAFQAALFYAPVQSVVARAYFRGGRSPPVST